MMIRGHLCKMENRGVRHNLGNKWIEVWECPECGREEIRPYEGPIESQEIRV